MRVKYLDQEHNAVPQPGLESEPPDPESRALTIRPPHLPNLKLYFTSKRKVQNDDFSTELYEI